MNDPEIKIDWEAKMGEIVRRFSRSLLDGDTFEGLDIWLAQVPVQYRGHLRDLLENCSLRVEPTAHDARSLETEVLSSSELFDRAGASRDSFEGLDLSSHKSIANCRTFDGLSDRARTDLQRLLTEKAFPAGTRLLQQFQPASGLYVITSGNVEVIDARNDERIAVDGAGSVLGEMSLLTDQPCSADVIATTDVSAMVLTTEDYRELTAEHPELEIALSQLVSDRLGGRRHDALCGKKLGEYQLTKCINRGGMGVVYEALQELPDQDHCEAVALKMLRHRFIYDESMQARFDQEAELLASLRHPNIISFRANFLALRTRFLVLDLCDGPDLFRLLRSRGPMDESVVRAIVGQIAEGLGYAHNSGVVHRDLKPGNVLVGTDGTVKLTDFGLSRLLQSEISDGKAVGTPSYMPPEQFREDSVGPTCDYYAFGCMVVEMLTGQLLFRGDHWKKLYSQKRGRHPSQVWPVFEASDELREVVHASLQPSPQNRQLDIEKIARWSDPTTVQQWQTSL